MARPSYNSQNEQNSEFNQQVIAVDRVARVVAGGRRFRFRALVVVGDGKGQVGMGVAKANEVSLAVDKATGKAKATMVNIPLVKHGTIPHAVQARYAGAEVLLKPASPGTGVIAGGAVRQVLTTAGVNDILSKILGSSSKLNNCYATFAALQILSTRNPQAKVKEPVKS